MLYSWYSIIIGSMTLERKQPHRHRAGYLRRPRGGAQQYHIIPSTYSSTSSRCSTTLIVKMPAADRYRLKINEFFFCQLKHSRRLLLLPAS